MIVVIGGGDSMKKVQAYNNEGLIDSMPFPDLQAARGKGSACGHFTDSSGKMVRARRIRIIIIMGFFRPILRLAESAATTWKYSRRGPPPGCCQNSSGELAGELLRSTLATRFLSWVDFIWYNFSPLTFYGWQVVTLVPATHPKHGTFMSLIQALRRLWRLAKWRRHAGGLQWALLPAKMSFNIACNVILIGDGHRAIYNTHLKCWSGAPIVMLLHFVSTFSYIKINMIHFTWLL